MAGFEGGSRFPFITLEKAAGRAQELYDADQRGNDMPISGAFEVWKYSEKSSGGFQTVAALKMYGLLEDAGSKESRKVKLTKHALDYFRDEREGVRAQKLKDFATNPPLFRALFNEHWGAQVPDDAIARSTLKIEGELNEQSARSALGIYKENMAFAAVKTGDKVTEITPVGPAQEVRKSGAKLPPPPLKPPFQGKVDVMQGERVVFTEENDPQTYVKVIASGVMDDALLEALEDYVKRQRKRLTQPRAPVIERILEDDEGAAN